MKTKILLSILAFGFFISAFGQKPTMELMFTSEYNGQNIALDSTLIINRTQGVDTTLYYPNVILLLEYNTGINDLSLGENSFSVSQNYPNPFKGKTSINLFLKEKGNIKIAIYDIVGKNLAQYENILIQGNTLFQLFNGTLVPKLLQGRS